MGVSNSVLAPRYDFTRLMLYININNIKPFKESIKFVEAKDLDKLLLEAISKGKKDFFDLIVKQIQLLKKSNPSSYRNTEFYEQCFSAIVNNTIPYYALRLIEINKDIVPTERRLLHVAIHFEREEIAHQLILRGSDVSAFDIIGNTPLEEAIRCNNLELVCMLLYYGAYTNNLENNLTSFMYSIICQSSQDIQRILMEYETDFNLCCNSTSILFFAIKYNSPVTLDIIERGANVNYCHGIHNAISLAMYCECDSDVFRLLWEQFDYDVWKTSYSKSVLLKLLQDYMSMPIWLEYLNILMENEAKLRLDLEHHNNSYFYKSDLLISTFFLQCFNIGIASETIEFWILHLLSHGAHIFAKDIDIIYSELKEFTPFLELLLYMDLQGDTYNLDVIHTVNRLMYFRYCPLPDMQTFILNVSIFPDLLSDIIRKLRNYCAFSNSLQMQVLDILGSETATYDICKRLLESSVTFPSLLQLSRDAARKSICQNYDIKNSCKLLTIVRYLGLPKCIENILLFNKSIYYYS
ncbi:hypothetical protein NQ318_015885 [Aromia moschata]|uniref:Ankyrin repeat protein n=1 Tax=Aromia moschata TaxID=1265417 RepID=A0AAV8Y0H4_9CUCU|nr:hypothetical protein NQ318_015885 [Aromia moschata]